VPALVALAGCYQQPAPPVAAAPTVNQPSDSTATEVAALDVPEGMKAVVLAVPGMH
jgi:hypothetical protein